METSELEKFETIERWLESVKQHNRKQELSRQAKRHRVVAMKDYLLFNRLCGEDLNPDELLEKAQEDRKDAIRRLTNYFNWVQGNKLEGVKPREKKIKRNSAITMQAWLRGFYTHNDIVFGKHLPSPRRVVSAVSKVYAKTPVYDYNEERGEMEFRNGLLQQFLANLNFRDQAIVMSLLSTGADATDLFSLNVGFVRGQWNEKRFFWHSNRLKDLEPFKTFFSVEATESVKRYVTQERKDAEDDEPLFVMGREFSYKRKDKKIIEIGGIMNTHVLAINLRKAAEKMGYDNKTNPFRPKRFRHLFRTACGMAHVDPGFTMAMMGHASDISASYLEKPRGLFLMEYIRVEPFLTVAGIQKEGFSELVSEVQQLSNKISELEGQLLEKTRRIDDLHRRIERFDKHVEKYKWVFDKFDEAYVLKEEPFPEEDTIEEILFKKKSKRDE